MVISHTYKFVTIEIPKTGTRTLRQTLDAMGVIDESIGGKDRHATARRAKELFTERGWKWDDYTKVCIVRNPWKRYVSYLHYMRSCVSAYEQDPSTLSDQMIKQCLSYRKFMGSRDDTHVIKRIINTQPAQSDFYEDANGKCMVNGFANTESLDHDIPCFCGRLGIPCPEIVRGNIGSYRRDYLSYYDELSIRMVARKEKRVIHRFGFKVPRR